MPKLNTTTSGIITATLTADSSPTLELQQNGVTIRTLGESQLVMGTAQSTATGAVAYDFTGIPSWVKRITVMFSGVSTNGSSVPIIQLGDAGGVETTGYLGGVAVNGAAANYTTGIGLGTSGEAATTIRHGSVILSAMGSNLWVAQGVIGRSDGAQAASTGSSKTLSDTLTQVRITTVNGTDTFDAGTVNIMWE